MNWAILNVKGKNTVKVKVHMKRIVVVVFDVVVLSIILPSNM